MASVEITVNGALMDGHKITFEAPCDCVSVENLRVRHIKNGTQQVSVFTMKDSHGNELTGLGNLFSKGAYVNVVLDINRGFAYLQNAATNKYLEQKTTPVDNFESDRADLSASARTAKVLNDKFGGTKFSVDSKGAYVEYTVNGTPVKKKLGNVIATVIGTGGAGEYDATGIDGYEDLTVDNFAFIPTEVTGSFSGVAEYAGGNMSDHALVSTGSSTSCSPTISYDPSTGKVTIGSTSNSGSATRNGTPPYYTLAVESSGSCSVTGKVVCYHN